VEKRGGERRPLLSDLHESGSLEQDADCIVFLWWGEYYNIDEDGDGTATADTVLFDITKHRNGATDEVTAACSMRRGTFSDLLPNSVVHRLPASQFDLLPHYFLVIPNAVLFQLMQELIQNFTTHFCLAKHVAKQLQMRVEYGILPMAKA
jgi:hypothetical protein